jgi:hypothetical protein
MSRGPVLGDHRVRVPHQGKVFRSDDPELREPGHRAAGDLGQPTTRDGPPEARVEQRRAIAPEEV